MTDDYTEMNRSAWDERTELHYRSRFYDVPGFLEGKSTLTEIERTELGRVADLRVLHLQCHFGLDTLSLAREGAICTGVDLSPVAIERATDLSRESGIDASFICANVLDYAPPAGEGYDMVFTSYGVVCWLSDLHLWAQRVAACLLPGGRLYLADFHPVHDLVCGYNYFEQEEPDIDTEGSYTENGGEVQGTMATWPHPLSAVLNALIDAGLQITRVNEYPFSPYPCFTGLQEREPGRYSLLFQGRLVPLVYTVHAFR